MHFPEYHIEHLLENICGWLQKEITEKIATRQMAKISWEDFDQKFKVLFERARRFELLDFTFKNLPEHSEIQQQVKIRPCYLKQLEAIGVVDDGIFEAVSDYLRAKVNRDKWIESGIIDEAVASDFENKLITYWQNLVRKIEITQRELSDEQRGELLYIECKERQETIRGESPPSTTIAGTYHALADEPVIGWHPNWNNLFPKPKEE